MNAYVCVCGTNDFSNSYRLLVLIILNFNHDCYGEYLTIANFNADLFIICLDDCLCVCEREGYVMLCYVFLSYSRTIAHRANVFLLINNRLWIKFILSYLLIRIFVIYRSNFVNVFRNISWRANTICLITSNNSYQFNIHIYMYYDTKTGCIYIYIYIYQMRIAQRSDLNLRPMPIWFHNDWQRRCILDEMCCLHIQWFEIFSLIFDRTQWFIL